MCVRRGRHHEHVFQDLVVVLLLVVGGEMAQCGLARQCETRLQQVFSVYFIVLLDLIPSNIGSQGS